MAEGVHPSSRIVSEYTMSSPSQALVFHHLRRRLLHNNLSLLLRGSPYRMAAIVAIGLAIWGGLFAAGAEGFDFLQQNHIPFSGSIIGTLFDFLFLALAVLLIFSTGIILYTGLFA